MSKGLEALKEVRKHRHESEKHLVIIDIDYLDECIETIEKELKALEIIKKYGHFDNDTGDLIVHVPDGKNEDKEYDLLKEVLS